MCLAVPYELMVPDHTRDALFQLCCDLRANPIKDKHWVLVHWRRLKPRTFPGWIVSIFNFHDSLKVSPINSAAMLRQVEYSNS